MTSWNKWILAGSLLFLAACVATTYCNWTLLHGDAEFLSPFDSAVIQRERGRSVFDFDYTIECYVPEAKRQFGYFVLPLVYGDEFVGRMDCKAHRSQGRFEIKALFVEAAVPDAFMPAFREAVQDYATFTGCHEVEVGKVVPGGLSGEFRRLFAH